MKSKISFETVHGRQIAAFELMKVMAEKHLPFSPESLVKSCVDAVNQLAGKSDKVNEIESYLPHLAMNKSNGFIVLFKSPRAGMVVEKGSCECFPIGTVKDDWNRADFEPLADGELGRTWEVAKP